MKKLKLFTLLLVIFLAFQSFAFTPVENPDPHRFDDAIQSFIKYDQKNAFPEDPILFAGSSSIRMWMSHDAFPDLPIINRGFGGAHISDVNFFIYDVVMKYSPKIIVFYCGDNDIAGKKSPEQVLSDYKTFVETVHKKFPKTKIVYVPIKPSIARWDMWPTMETTNKMIKDYSDESKSLYYVDIATPMFGKDGKPMQDLFMDDGLHLNEKGYELWNSIVGPLLKKNY